MNEKDMNPQDATAILLSQLKFGPDVRNQKELYLDMLDVLMLLDVRLRQIESRKKD